MELELRTYPFGPTLDESDFPIEWKLLVSKLPKSNRPMLVQVLQELADKRLHVAVLGGPVTKYRHRLAFYYSIGDKLTIDPIDMLKVAEVVPNSGWTDTFAEISDWLRERNFEHSSGGIVNLMRFSSHQATEFTLRWGSDLVISDYRFV
jgi:hypothetical protein